jgi:hypothetical protein
MFDLLIVAAAITFAEGAAEKPAKRAAELTEQSATERESPSVDEVTGFLAKMVRVKPGHPIEVHPAQVCAAKDLIERFGEPIQRREVAPLILVIGTGATKPGGVTGDSVEEWVWKCWDGTASARFRILGYTAAKGQADTKRLRLISFSPRGDASRDKGKGKEAQAGP